jgi:subtilisin family serine protease
VCASRLFALITTCLLPFQFTIQAQTKSIRLRNETIVTNPSATNLSAANPALARSKPVSGLFLLQFQDHPQPAWRGQLKSLGVDLLRYVPDDAFIARLENAQPSQIQSLGFVRWLGPYRPEHKVHPRLITAAREALQTNKTVAVSVLIAPRATPAEIAGVRNLFSAVDHESHLRQGTVVRGMLRPAHLNALAQSDSVLWIDRAPKRKLVDEVSSKVVGGDDGATGTPTVTQQEGFGGAGVTVAVADTGLDTGDTNTIHPDLNGRVKALLFYGSLTNAADEHSHGTHVAGIIAGNAASGEADDSGSLYGLGVAWQASLVAQRIFDANGNPATPFPSDETLAHDAVNAGAVIGSNSWGDDTQGQYDLDASQFDELVRDADPTTAGDQQYILEFSAGNAGPDSQTIGSPAVAKNVIATGATENGRLDFPIYADGDGIDVMADFSSRGPCEDGRIKPDVVAPGTWISSLLSADATAQFAWEQISSDYIYMGGTSQSGPHASGAAAIFVQYYKSLHTNALPSPALVKAALINSAVELDESYGNIPIPNFDEGWGRINLTNLIITNAVSAPRNYEFVDQTALLVTGQIFEHHTFVQTSGQPLKITLTYTDVAGNPAAILALVNDLDLEVIGPDGTMYRGNQFVGGESIPNASIADNLNNVEAVHLNQPLPGDYLIRVRARNVVEDARLDTPAIDQDFALVVSGDLSRPGLGAILLDRPAYTAPSVIKVEVFDAARAGNSSVNVLVKSATEPSGETFTLQAAGNFGSFTGAVATVLGNAVADGKLEIHNGDSIEADYLDAAHFTRIATAVADLFPPMITGVASAVDLGQIAITWQTDEPSDSVVRYGTNFAFNFVATDSTLTTTHLVRLANLVAGRTYQFFVTSTDVAGNTGTNNNAGVFYNFVAIATPTVLMVDAYEPADGSPVIDDGTYTNALAATGLSFGFWKVTDRGTPQLADLKPFQAVIWRVTDDIVNYDGTNNTLTAEQQFMIQTYLNGGGSFFMASMGILSQVGNVSFRRDVLHVGGFIQNDNPPFPCSDCDEYFGVPAITGAPGNPITSGINVTLDYSNYPDFDFGDGSPLGPDFSDTFTPTTNATAVVFESASGKPCGMSYPRPGQDSPGRVVFLSFPLDTIPSSGAPPDNEITLLRNALKFLIPGAQGVGTISLDNSAYTVPDVVAVEVGDSDLAGTGAAQVTFSTSPANNTVITLNETTRKGLFRGSLTLVGANSPGTNQLRVQNGDVLTAAYFDASAGTNATATAIIDTQPPVISNVATTAKYADASVTWTTSKPANSLVQFGESMLLGRTASQAPLTTNHIVGLSGLGANRTYYYQVVSRDEAGNTTTDDNNGNLYTFHTLRALQPPWFDNMDTGALDWTVVPGSGTQVNWTLGVPDNGIETNAYSPPDAWGSNLNGQFVDQADTSLYSPVIDLSGFSQATLTFWDSFDFTGSSAVEGAEVMISTNSASSPVSLVQFISTTTGGWEQETVDLTPYVGLTVQLIWHYVEFTIDKTTPPGGWLVDDVAISVPETGPGMIIISNNLAQGVFSLTGPLTQSGPGPFKIITNAPPGQYVVHFGDVPFYIAPTPQTNMLAATESVTFSGIYTFPDTNHNGISDLWEQQNFGSVSTNRTQTTDTDHDGMSDYDEFLAGTDPNNPSSNLKILSAAVQTNGLVSFQWSAVPGRIYQVQASGDLKSWLPAAAWTAASSNAMVYTPTNSAGSARFFRVQVRP